MKTQVGLFISVSTSDELRERAKRAGAPIGDLADLALRFALGKLNDHALAKWASALPSRRGRNGGSLGKDERSVLQAFDRLSQAEPGASRWGLGTLASEAGLRLSVAFWALKSLQVRGLVTGAQLEETDRWGRPTKSFWRRSPA